MRPKPAFFAIARELRPVTVGMARKDVKTLDNPSSDAYFKIEQSVRKATAERLPYTQLT
jgi:beta-mannosidase